MSQGPNPQSDPSGRFAADGRNEADESRQTQDPSNDEANADDSSEESTLQATNVKVVKAADDSDREVI